MNFIRSNGAMRLRPDVSDVAYVFQKYIVLILISLAFSVIYLDSACANCMSSCYGGYSHTDIDCTQRCINEAANSAAKSAEDRATNKIDEFRTQHKKAVDTLNADNENLKAITDQIKEKTIATDKRSEEIAKSSQETQKLLEIELQEQKQKVKELQEKINSQNNVEKIYIFQQIQMRLHKMLSDIVYEREILDPIMMQVFAEASKINPTFKSLFEDLKAAKDTINLLNQKATSLEKIFWNILRTHEDLEKLLEDSIQLTIAGDNLFMLEPKQHNEL